MRISVDAVRYANIGNWSKWILRINFMRITKRIFAVSVLLEIAFCTFTGNVLRMEVLPQCLQVEKHVCRLLSLCRGIF